MNKYNKLIERVDAIKEITNNISNFPIEKLNILAEEIIENFKNNKKIAFVGNGGSAAEAIHLAAEFTGKCVFEHSPLPALCLNESQSAITAIANDFGQKYIFSRMVEAQLMRGDILIALSTSGKSENVIECLKTARAIGVKCFLWMGQFDCNLSGIEVFKVESKSTPRIQEIHLMWGHLLAEIVELEFPTHKLV